MMKRCKTFLIGAGILCLFSAACANLRQPSLKVEYYTLEYALPPMTGLAPTPQVLRVHRFGVAPMYHTSHMIYRDRAFRRQAYTYHKWRSNPADLVTHFLARDMKQSGLFKAVVPRDSKTPASFMIEGSVDEFFEWDQGTEWMAALTVTVTLIKENEPDISQRVLFQKTYRTREVSRGRNPGDLAEAMGLGMAKVSEAIIRDIVEAVRR